MRDKFQSQKSKKDTNDYSQMNIESEEHGRENGQVKLVVNEQNEREFYVDWIKAMSIHFVIAVHCVQLSIDATGLESPESYAAN